MRGYFSEKDVLIDQLYHIAGSEFVRTDVPLRELTSFRIGGPASVVVTPVSQDILEKVIRLLNHDGQNYVVLGRGTNILAADEGYQGVVVRICDAMQNVKVQGSIIVAETGASLKSIADTALSHGLGGLEFASGIPGSLGGGLYMNAGAYGSEIKDVLQEVTAIDSTGRTFNLGRADMKMGYRESILQSKSWTACQAVLQLTERDPAAIKALMKEYAQRRKSTQPLEYPSAGSVFKRPEGYYAGALIEAAGLKGYSVGGAQVSEKHAGFIINKGGATCRDVLELVHHIRRVVYEKSGIMLVPEIRYLSARGLDTIR